MDRTEVMFASLKNFDVRLLFFHLPEQIAFLRLHKPEKYGDSLRKARPSIVLAQTKQISMTAFETGKLFDGFRTIYPLFHKKQFVGTVEIAYPFLALKKQAIRQAPGAYTFLVKRSIQEGKSKASQHYPSPRCSIRSFQHVMGNNTKREYLARGIAKPFQNRKILLCKQHNLPYSG